MWTQAVVIPLLFVAANAAWAAAADLVNVGDVKFVENVLNADDLSAVTRVGETLIVASDEGASLQTLMPDGDDRYRVQATIALRDDNKEVDLEGLTATERVVYAIGSHSAARKRAKSDKSYQANRERLTDVSIRRPTRALYRLRVNDDCEVVDREQINLIAQFEEDDYLKQFVGLPSKENGVDIEGLAIAGDDLLWIGCRGPVLRGAFAPVIVLDFDNPDDYEIRFVQLGGLGVRDLAWTKAGLLVLAGPVAEGRSGFRLFLWDGRDSVPGDDRVAGEVRLVADVPSQIGAPEGLCVLEESDDRIELLIVFDGAADAGAAKFKLDLGEL